jgi:hypothetical protein
MTIVVVVTARTRKLGPQKIIGVDIITAEGSRQ